MVIPSYLAYKGLQRIIPSLRMRMPRIFQRRVTTPAVTKPGEAAAMLDRVNILLKKHYDRLAKQASSQAALKARHLGKRGGKTELVGYGIGKKNNLVWTMSARIREVFKGPPNRVKRNVPRVLPGMPGNKRVRTLN